MSKLTLIKLSDITHSNTAATTKKSKPQLKMVAGQLRYSKLSAKPAAVQPALPAQLDAPADDDRQIDQVTLKLDNVGLFRKRNMRIRLPLRSLEYAFWSSVLIVVFCFMWLGVSYLIKSHELAYANQALNNSKKAQFQYKSQLMNLERDLATAQAAARANNVWDGHFFHLFPTLWPVMGRVVSRFGGRPDPFDDSQEFHPGLDIRANLNTPIFAAADGRVVTVEENAIYGRTIVLEHTENLTSKYAHLSQIRVKQGQQVTQGQLIGLSGDTGKVTGPHLHFELRKNGTIIDPTQFLTRAYHFK